SNKARAVLPKKKRSPFVRFWMNMWAARALFIMALPAITLFIMFNYMPLFGLQLAFKKFDVMKGIFGSPWVGLSNIRFLFLSGDTFWRITRNTVLYYLLFTATGTVLNILLAIGINEFTAKKLGKSFQTIMIMPTFISYAAVSIILSSILKSKTGMVNRFIIGMGGKNISFYLKAEYWPLILWIVRTWKGTGYGSVLYLAVLAGIDQEMYEAAYIDGVNARQKMWYITIPQLIPMVVVLTLLGLGGIMNSDTGLFYQVTKNTGTLYKTTQVIDSYVYNALLTNADFGTTTATTLYQSLVGFVMVMATNLIVRQFAPENALF
ncbi:MAG: sugar ABC transporter permease, partial [Clostridia bacterium]|nr:sugar ABC transporter permease [Clostridia bacterium]